MPPRGGRLSSSGAGGPRLAVTAHIEGVPRTSEEFKQARRQFNMAMRGVIETAGRTAVLPQIKSAFPRGATGRMAGSLFVKRDRTTVFIGSHMRGAMNRAVGWLDFGGKRPRDHTRRRGPHVIVNTLQERRSVIDEAVLDGILKTFHPLETSKSVGL